MDTLSIIQDRTFDAECAKRLGLFDLQAQIIKRLKASWPSYVDYIDQCSEVYSRVGDAMTQPRGEYLKEHQKSLRLRYR